MQATKQGRKFNYSIYIFIYYLYTRKPGKVKVFKFDCTKRKDIMRLKTQDTLIIMVMCLTLVSDPFFSSSLTSMIPVTIYRYERPGLFSTCDCCTVQEYA
jgi:hypothetical protein